MSIPFTQYLRPRGRQSKITIQRAPEVQAAADRFIEAGGWYEAEVLTTGEVSLTACLRDEDGDDIDVEGELVANAPGVGEAVDRLVERSIKHIGQIS